MHSQTQTVLGDQLQLNLSHQYCPPTKLIGVASTPGKHSPSYTSKRGTVIQQVVLGINNDAPIKSRYTLNLKCVWKKTDVIEYSAKSYGYFPLKKTRERMWIFLKGKDVFVCLTTGCGKTACYIRILLKTFDLILTALLQGQ